jgi:hypothetical protein
MTLSILLSLFTSLFAQPDTSIHTTVEAQAIVSDAGVTPFWMRSLQYGSVPMENPGLVLRAWNGKGYNLKKKYDWKYEVEATGWTGKQNDFWLTQAYVSGRRGKWELWAGRRKEVYGLGDTAMTSGFYAWSGNAMPMPKIQLGTRDYLNFTKGWLGVHMTYSHGWFDNQGPTTNSFLHQKTLYGRIGKPESTINLFGGINHQVRWGGENTGSNGEKTPFGKGLNTYFYVISLLKNRNYINVDPNAPWFETNYQYGSHLGSIDLMMTLNQKFGKISIYSQSSWETGRVASLIHANDGLFGFSIKLNKTKLIKHITFENLFTANMGSYNSGISKFFGMSDPHPGEIENYFNNANGSWEYFGKGIGTPVIIIDSEGLPKGKSYFSFNAVNSLYLGIAGDFSKKINYKLRLLYGRHGQTPINGYKRDTSEIIEQTSISSNIEKKISTKLRTKLELSIDYGKRTINSKAVSLGLLYNLF